MFMLPSSGSGFVSGGGSEEDVDNDYQKDDLGFPQGFSQFSTFNIHMVGSCNGLICLHDSKHGDVSLWNPATRQFRTLPKPITIEEVQGVLWSHCFVAFGFDVKTKDYKVVHFSLFLPPPVEHYSSRVEEERYSSRVQVYSLSTDSWRLLEGIHSLPALPDNVMYRNQGIYLNGCYFFVGGNYPVRLVCNINSWMYSFDFTKEILTTMQFPDHDTRHNLILSCLGGEKIALFIIQGNSDSIFFDCGDYEYYDIWVLNKDEQHGSSSGLVVNKESWTKLYSFPKLNISKHPTQPRCILNNGEFALISTVTTSLDGRSKEKLQLFNLVTKEVEKDIPFSWFCLFRADVYTQSLVSIIGGNGAAAATCNRR